VLVLRGEAHERVLEARLVQPHVPGVNPGRVQREDHRVDELTRPGDDDVTAVAFDPGHLGQAGQQALVERARRQEPHGLPAPGPRDEPGRGVQGDDVTRVDQCHPVTQPLGFFHKVGDQQNRRTAVADPLDEPPGFAAALGIQAGCHLVEDCDPRPADERQCHRQPLPLATGQ